MGRETVGRKPFIDCIHAILVRRYKSLDLILRKVGAVTLVQRVTEGDGSSAYHDRHH